MFIFTKELAERIVSESKDSDWSVRKIRGKYYIWSKASDHAVEVDTFQGQPLA